MKLKRHSRGGRENFRRWMEKAIKRRPINSHCWAFCSFFLGSEPGVISIYSTTRRIYGLITGRFFTLRARQKLNNYDSFAEGSQSIISLRFPFESGTRERREFLGLFTSAFPTPTRRSSHVLGSIACHKPCVHKARRYYIYTCSLLFLLFSRAQTGERKILLLSRRYLCQHMAPFQFYVQRPSRPPQKFSTSASCAFSLSFLSPLSLSM